MASQQPALPTRDDGAPPRPRTTAADPGAAHPGAAHPAPGEAGGGAAPAAGTGTDLAEPDHSWFVGATRETPLPWTQRTTARERRPSALRLPAPGDPAPDTARMLGVCAWAALLCVVGLAVAGRAMVALLAGSPPGWYEPTVIGAGVSGIGLTAAAFLAVHHRRLPWVLLTAATIPLAVGLTSTAIAL